MPCSPTCQRSASTARPACWRPAPARRILTYMHGRAAVPPLAGGVLTDAALVSVADLLRRYHRAVASFDPAGYRWPRPIPATFRTDLVSHNDVHPANLVFRGGRPSRSSTSTGPDPAAPSGISPRPRATGHHCSPTGTSPMTGKAERWRGSGSSWTRAACPAPGAVRSPKRSWPTTTGRTQSSPRRPPPGTRGSPITGALSRNRSPEPGAGACGIGATCWPRQDDRAIPPRRA
jgi:hypothetical protein